MLGIQNISKEVVVSLRMLMRWMSILRFFEMGVKSCLTWWPRWNRGVDLVPSILFSIFLEILYIYHFLEKFDSLSSLQFLCLRSMGAMQGSTSISSKGVDFITLSINISAPFWTASRSLICLVGCIVCLQMMLPYSNFEQMKYLKISIARVVTCLEIVLVYYMLYYICNIFNGRTEWEIVIYYYSLYFMARDLVTRHSIYD